MKVQRSLRENVFTLLVAALLIAFGAAAAPAATLTVPSTAYPTIQSAVDAAAPGDTVKVKWGGGAGPNGEYFENVVIQTPIRLYCPTKKRKGPAVIDVSEKVTTIAGNDYSAGIYVESGGAGTTIDGCTVQFAQFCDAGTTPACPNNEAPGHGIAVNAADVTIMDVLVHGCQASGVRIYGSGDGFAMLNTTSNANGRNGFVVGEDDNRADNGTIKKCKASGNGNDEGGAGFSIQGYNLTVTGNRADQNDYEGFYIRGNGSLIRGNSATANNGHCYYIPGNDLVVEDNKADLCGDDCFRSGNIEVGNDGNDITFRNNTAYNCGNDGFDVDCNESGGSCGDITGNRAVGVVNEAFDLNFHRGNTIANNHAEMAENQGFRVSELDTVMFRNNTAVDNGRAGIRSSDGFDNIFRNNTSRNNGGDGLRLVNDGARALLEGNDIQGNWQDGIDINRDVSTGNVVNDNKVVGNRGTGIENDAQGTDITNNTSKKNRTDMAGAGARMPPTGTVGANGGNSFKTGGFGASTPGTGWNDGNIQ